MNIIQFNPGNSIIDIRALHRNTPSRSASGLISPAKETVGVELAPEHAAEPIKSMNDILRITTYLKENNRWRDNMFFIVGINFGLRISDLRMLRFCDLINPDFSFKESFPVFEKKTRNTRKRKKNRYVSINDAVVEAVTLYLANTPNVSLSDYLFRSESNRGGNSNNPMARYSFERILKEIAADLGIASRVSTHTLRKTFGYWIMVRGGNDPRTLLLLQRIFGHSTVAQTLTYIGVSEQEIHDAYMNLNIGYSGTLLVDSNIYESDAVS